METQVKLSFIIPVYNGQNTIERCLDSIANLNLPENEIEAIVVDDCSSDDTISVLDGYASSHSFVRYCHLSVNKKPGGARNYGLKIAIGRFIMFLDSDDTAESGVLDALSYALRCDVDVLLCRRSKQIELDGTFVNERIDVPIHQSITGRFFLENYYLIESMGSCSSYLFKKSFLDSIDHSFVEFLFFEDTDWVEFTLYHCSRIEYDNSVNYAYYSNPSSILHSMNLIKEADIILNCCRRMQFASSVKEDVPALFQHNLCHKERIASILNFRHLTRFSRKDVRYFYNRLKAHNGFSWLEQLEWQGFTHCLVFQPGLALSVMSFFRPFLRCGRGIIQFVRSHKCVGR